MDSKKNPEIWIPYIQGMKPTGLRPQQKIRGVHLILLLYGVLYVSSVVQ